jgi:DNA-directed RNA polymerase specialized sigma24 family protein
MTNLEKEQKVLIDVYYKEPEISEAMYELLYETIDSYFFKHHRISRCDCSDLVADTLTILWNMPEPPKISGKAHIYLLGIAVKMHIYKKRRSKEDSYQNNRLDQFASVDNIIAQLEVKDRILLLNNLLSKLSPRCKELLERYILEDKPNEIRKDMNYSSMNMYYKKKSQCVEKLITMGMNDPECRRFFNQD